MSKYLHNLSIEEKTYRGFTLDAGSFFEIPFNQEIHFANDNSVLVDIANEILAVSSDGITDISGVSNQINFLKNNIPKEVVMTDGTMDVMANQFDTDFAQIVRVKAAKRGWSFWAVPIEVTTSTIDGSLFIQDVAGSPIPWINCKIYDGNNAEITTPGLLNANLNQCVKTVIDFEPTFDFEIIGGSLRINSNPSQDVRLWIVGAPDIPVNLGGSKEFASGINLKFLGADSPLEIDGRVTKFLQYNPSTHQGKMRIVLKHPAGTQVNMQLTIQLYRL